MFPKPEKKKKVPKPIQRKTPLKRSTKPIRQRRKTPRRTARVVDQSLLEAVRQQPCTACRAVPPSDPDHITHRGAGGGDTADNVMPLCRRCHSRRHQVGWKRFFQTYPAVYGWLKKAGRFDIIGDVSSDPSTTTNYTEGEKQ